MINKENFLTGRTKIYFGDTVSSLVEVGSASSISLAVEIETAERKSGNYGLIDIIEKAVTAEYKFNMDEIDIEKYQQMTDTGTYETVAGTLVEDATQIISDAEANVFYKIENQNGDGSLITVDSITGLTVDTDYEIIKDTNGDYGIVFLAEFSGDKTVTYDYTPSASKKFKLGVTGEPSAKCVRFVVEDSDGSEDFKLTSEYAFKTSGFSFTFPDKDSPEEWVSPEITFKAIQDPNDPTSDVIVFEDLR